MVSMNNDPEAGGNTAQPDDGRDADGRLPEPLDAAHYGNPDGPGFALPGMPWSQPAGTGPVVSATAPEEDDFDHLDHVEHRDDSAAAQGGAAVEHDISGSPVVGSPVVGDQAAASAPAGMRNDTSGTMQAAPAKKTVPAKKTAPGKTE